MAREPLSVLLLIRQQAIDRARQVLGDCLRLESSAEEVLRLIDEAEPRERALANRYSEHPHGMEMFAAWLKRNSTNRYRAMAALTAARDQSAIARAALAAARSASRVVETVINERAAVVRAEADKRDQHTLDDITRKRRPQEDRRDDGLEKLG